MLKCVKVKHICVCKCIYGDISACVIMLMYSVPSFSLLVNSFVVWATPSASVMTVATLDTAQTLPPPELFLKYLS